LRGALESLEDDAYIENDLDDALNAEELPEEQEDYEEGKAEESNWQIEFKKKDINKEYDDDRDQELLATIL
ncbi:15023_t:CDS:2, partial [Racocetra fulgida]